MQMQQFSEKLLDYRVMKKIRTSEYAQIEEYFKEMKLTSEYGRIYIIRAEWNRRLTLAAVEDEMKTSGRSVRGDRVAVQMSQHRRSVRSI